jgi:hypothetical protein
MATNVITYISENLFLFLPLGIAGVSITIYLYFTGKKEEPEKEKDLNVDFIKFSKLKINIYVLIYSFIFTMYIITGFLSDFVVPILVCGCITLIPIILTVIANYKTKDSKV